MRYTIVKGVVDNCILIIKLQLLLNLCIKVFKGFLDLFCLTTKSNLILLLKAFELARRGAEEVIFKAASDLILQDTTRMEKLI
jgi:hypothetical protein